MSLLRRKRAAPPLLAPIATQSMAARPLPAGANVNRNRAGARVDSAAWLRAILTAPVYDIARRTPLEPAPRLSARLGASVLLKREDLQPVFSFKLRGAYACLAQLDAAERARGVLAVSAGNHAQGVALGARELGIDAVIVMPATTPQIKISAVEALGARIVLHGDSYDDAAAHGRVLCEREGRSLIHPYDDDAVIAGQGTVAMELLAQHRGRLDAVFIPVGGGGLCAGMAVYLKTLDPGIRVIAVEPDDAACLAAAMRAGAPVRLDQIGLFVDGCAVREIGARPFELLREYVDEVITVDADAVCAAIRDVFEDTRSIVEPAGALAVAGMKRWAGENSAAGRHLAAVLSGANMNFDRLAHVAERAAVGEQNEAIFGVTIPERPGSFLAFCRSIGRRAITEFNYRWQGGTAAQVYLAVKLKGGNAERFAIRQSLTESGYACLDYTEDEVARLHVRHLVGGAAPGLGRERLFRFEFPERPGALLQFLETLGTRWNISLFHYRNHGAAYGRVLAGFEVGFEHDAAFEADLARLGFWHCEESTNPALRQFLRA
ncbi:MAG: threonine ammonia-lyase, biosynthetic [Chiayiivirga sp.]|jgi:threonine dehydratase|uniref:threonine ammonia-lyase, biosynthetic n=1 Tax=Chiayiivirga sp. TaxID=2041042 RepID=UPI0025C53CBF|nr:threonine ammonia-lyase, biosynthetic [Chiayiivirga sp.]MCI1710578.1 threonine ammonia-lyase, biosynthetic [Chiayiivirga sp.]MCI1728584.1 threonine ammonia-lyase, biosynthetic [Chiayiivirga sp.]